MLTRTRRHDCDGQTIHRHIGLIAAIGVCLGWGVAPVQGLNIILNFDEDKSATNFTTDPNATELKRIMRYVEDFYEDVIQDPHEITINYWYTNIGDAFSNPLADHKAVSSSNGRETEADIRFDTFDKDGVIRPWWYDPTPEENSEFNMIQQLWRSLTPTLQSDLFNKPNTSNIPETFEVSYTGRAFTGNPAESQWDILTSALHEVGHALGVNGPASASSDNDYDFNPTFIFLQNLAVETDFDENGVPNGDDAHLEPSFTLMAGSAAQKGLRRLPSHTDLFAMASGDLWLDLDVPRREFYGNSDWNNSINWSGNKVPGIADDVFIRSPQGDSNPLNVTLSAFGSAKNVSVSEGANFNTGALTLTVDKEFSVTGAGSDIFVAAGGTLETEDLFVRFNSGFTVSGTVNASDDVTVTGTGSDLFILSGGRVNADELFIFSTAEVEMSGGIIDARRITINAGTQIESNGGSSTVMASSLVNNGKIETANGQINFLSSEGNPWDLDGASEAGIVDASDGNLNFLTGGLADPFDGTMRVGAGHFLSIAADWTNDSGTLDLNGGSDFDSRARLDGALAGTTVNFFSGAISASGVAHIDTEVKFFGGVLPNQTEVTLGADDSLNFNEEATIGGGEFTLGNSADMRFNDDTTINGGTFNIGEDAAVFFKGDTTISGGTFNTFNTQFFDGFAVFEGDTIYDGGTITVNGIVLQEGNASVEAPTTINADVFDFDGASLLGINLTVTTRTLNDALTINADQIDETDNVFDDHITINNTPGAGTAGQLTINLPGKKQWTLGPTSNLIMTGRINGFSSVIEGSDFNLDGTAGVTNNVSWASQTDITGAANINAISNLRLLGGTIAEPNRLQGGTITGPGTLSTIGDHALVGHGTIATKINFINQAELRANNGTLVVSGTINDVGIIGTADTDGILQVTNPWQTDVANAVELRGGSIIGAKITNASSGLIRGHGTLAPNNLDNQGTIAAVNGRLIIDPGALDLDGSTEDGQIEAINGNLTVVNELLEFFDGTATVGATRTLTFNAGWRLGETGQLNLNGGANPANVFGTLQHLHGNVTVDQNVIFNIPTTFKPTTIISLPDTGDTLRLVQDSTVEAGAAFTGGGVLVNTAGNTLTLEDDASVDVELVNIGTLEVGGSPGSAAVQSFVQTDIGTLHIEFEGTGPSEFDQLNVTDNVSLNGTLDITTPEGFTPNYGDVFDVLTYDTRSGLFDQVNGAILSPLLALGQFYDDANGVLQLLTTAPGDANGDLIVTIDDFGVLAGNFNQPGTWETGDFDGDGMTTINDFGLLAANFNGDFNTLMAAAESLGISIPEPGTATLLGLAVLGVTTRRQR